jgi:hypothetical protein
LVDCGIVQSFEFDELIVYAGIILRRRPCEIGMGNEEGVGHIQYESDWREARGGRPPEFVNEQGLCLFDALDVRGGGEPPAITLRNGSPDPHRDACFSR